MNTTPKSDPTTKMVNVGSVNLHVTEYSIGKSDPVFLLHGIGSREMSWWPVLDQLAEHFHLVIPDHRGHGASDKPETGYQVPDYAADFAGLLAAYGVERPRIVGHSLGGMVAMNWASRNPSSARCLVIEDSPFRRADDVEGLFNNWIALASGTIEEAAANYAAGNPHWTREECLRRAESITLTKLAVFEEMKQRNLDDVTSDRMIHIAKVKSPTLLVYGDPESGGMVSESDAQRFQSLLPSATIAHITGGSHSLHRDTQDQFLAVTVPFLEQH